MTQKKDTKNNQTYINITSEIGKLRRVMLHRPAQELESLTPDTMNQLLFDDVPYLKVAQKEHDYFAQVLKAQDVEVIYLEDYLKDILIKDHVKKEFIEDFVRSNEVYSDDIKEAMREYYSGLIVDELINIIFAGVQTDKLKIKLNKFTDIIHKNTPHRVTSLFWVNPLPNLYFTRDPSAALGNGLNIHYMRKKARRVETLFLTYIHKYHPNFKNVPLWYNRDLKYPIEGGDVLVLSKEVVAVGYSERTSAKAIEVWAEKLLSSSENSFNKVLVFTIPKTRAFMHLDTVFTMVDYDKFTLHPEATGEISAYELTLKTKGALNVIHLQEKLSAILAKALNLPAVKLLECGGGDLIAAGREQWNDGSNTLVIAPGKVIVYDRNEVTNNLLVKNGIDIIAISSSELSRGRGGPRCMSMPLYRDDL